MACLLYMTSGKSLFSHLCRILCEGSGGSCAPVIPGWNSWVPIGCCISQGLVTTWSPISLGQGVACLKDVRSPMGSGLGSKFPRAQMTGSPWEELSRVLPSWVLEEEKHDPGWEGGSYAHVLEL